MKKVLFTLVLSVSLSIVPFFTATATTDKSSNAIQHLKMISKSSQSDGKIIKTVMVIDKSEIAAAKVALKRSNNLEVKKFAQTMIDQHGQNLQAAMALSNKLKVPAVASVKSKLLQKNGQQGLKKLQSVQQKQFDLTYINAMVKGHAEALGLFKTKLLPNARNPQLVEFLKATKATVARHLLLAKKAKSVLTSEK